MSSHVIKIAWLVLVVGILSGSGKPEPVVVGGICPVDGKEWPNSYDCPVHGVRLEQDSKPIPVPSITAKDGAEMVLIPAGEFAMGSPRYFWSGPRDHPPHKVYVDAFYMDTHEVTVGQYKRYLQETGEKLKIGFTWEEFARRSSPTDEHPMNYVSWYDASAYCKWAGKRLPTEAEWEKAARGGNEGKLYPWGDAFIENRASFRDSTTAEDLIYAPVMSFPPNGYGLYDMEGNVGEWCADIYEEDYYNHSPYRNPKGPTDETPDVKYRYRVVRGSTWGGGPIKNIAFRQGLWPFQGPGFRCAKDVMETDTE